MPWDNLSTVYEESLIEGFFFQLTSRKLEIGLSGFTSHSLSYILYGIIAAELGSSRYEDVERAREALDMPRLERRRTCESFAAV